MTGELKGTEPPKERQVTGAELFAEWLHSRGIGCLFTVPGEPVTNICKTAYEQGIRVVTTHHEQAASFAAQAYSYMSGNLGVALTVSGVGMANAVTGLVNAQANGWPFLLVSGAPPRRHWERGAFQELRHLDLARPVSKWAASIDQVQRVPEFLSMAERIAFSGRPGPVFLEMPEDVIKGAVPFSRPRRYPRRAVTQGLPQADPHTVRQAASLLRSAKRPVMVIGKGCRWSEPYGEIRKLADAGLPVVPMPMARGMIPDDHEMCFAGARAYALRSADLILAVGTRFNWMLRMGYSPTVNQEAKVIQIDIQAEEIGANRPVDVGLVGDAKLVLRQLINELDFTAQPLDTSAWFAALRTEREENRARTEHWATADDVPIKPHRFFRELKNVMDKDSILAVDGEITMAVSRMEDLHYMPAQRLDAGSQGCIGTAVAFAVGAKLARPHKPVICVSGDCSFGYSCMEMETALRVGVPIVFVVLDNEGIGGKMSEEHYFGPEWKGILSYRPGIRYGRIMEAFGGAAEYVDRPNQIRGALERALKRTESSCIHVAIDGHCPAVPGRTTEFL